MTLVDFHYVELPPSDTDMHIQTDGDHTKCVVTPFRTIHFKKFRNLGNKRN